MTKNVTLRLDALLLTRLRHRAVDSRKSLSAWIVDTLEQTIEGESQLAASRKRALARLRRGLRLGGKPMSREEAHAR